MNLKILGSNATEITGATIAKDIPAFVNRNPIVTLTYPYKTPNGKNKNIKMLGWIFLDDFVPGTVLMLIQQVPYVKTYEK